jgi:iron complex outermembrane receptor protein
VGGLKLIAPLNVIAFRNFLLVLCLGFSYSFVNGQNNTISGRVTDTEGVALEGASVLVVGTKKGTVTNSGGQYTIDQVANGSYQLVVSYLGYTDFIQSVNLTGRALSIDAILRQEVEQLQDVEIVGRRNTDYKPDVTFAGTRTGAPIKVVPQSIAVINKEIIADQGLFRIEEVTNNVAGVTKWRDSDGFMSRGFRLSHDYINGNRALIATDFASSSIATQYERVEFIKGPAAALFGNSSPGGVVNAVTKKPLTENRATASLSTGSFNNKRATMDVTGPLRLDKSLLYRVNFAWENTETFRDYQKQRTIMFAPSVSYIPNEKTRFNVDIVGTFGNDDIGVDRGMPVLQGDLFALPLSFNTAEPYDNRQNSSVLLTVAGSHKFSDVLSLNVSYTRSDFNQNFLETRSNNQFTPDGTELIRQINDRKTKGSSDFVTAYLVGKFNTGSISHEGVLGWDYFETFQDSRTRSAVGEANGVPNLKFNNRVVYDKLSQLSVNFSEIEFSYTGTNRYRGFYVQDLMGIGKFKILAGLRFENLDQFPLFGGEGFNFTDNIDNTIVLPRLGLTYELNDQVNLFASYTESFSPQTLPFGSAIVETDEVFDPLSSDQIEFGTKTSFFNDKLLAQLSLYRINRQGRLIEDPGATGSFIKLIQIGKEKSSGAELDVTGRISSNFTLTANYAYNQVDILDDEQGVNALELENNNPKHSGGFWGKYTITKGLFNNLGIGVGGNYISETGIVDSTPNRLNDRITFEAYFLARAALYYKADNFNVSFNLNNVFDERYFIGGLNAGRVFPGAPRTFLINVGYKF